MNYPSNFSFSGSLKKFLVASVCIACGPAQQQSPTKASGPANTPVAASGAAASKSRDRAVPPLPSLPRPAEAEAQVFKPIPNPVSDEAPWAAAFINHTTLKSGIESANSGRACDWLNWGESLENPAVGSYAVFDFEHGDCRGHIGLVVGKCGNALVILGGNQQNAVSQLAFPNDHIAGFRYPPGRKPMALDFDLPEVVPAGIASCQGMASDSQESTLARLPARSFCTLQAPGLAQALEVTRTVDQRVRFRAASSGQCARSLVGEAFEIFYGDLEIDAESGLAYPAEEYHFWADPEGKTGAVVRLSLAGKLRARVVEWGPEGSCKLSDAIMHCEAEVDP